MALNSFGKRCSNVLTAAFRFVCNLDGEERGLTGIHFPPNIRLLMLVNTGEGNSKRVYTIKKKKEKPAKVVKEGPQ